MPISKIRNIWTDNVAKEEMNDRRIDNAYSLFMDHLGIIFNKKLLLTP